MTVDACLADGCARKQPRNFIHGTWLSWPSFLLSRELVAIDADEKERLICEITLDSRSFLANFNFSHRSGHIFLAVKFFFFGDKIYSYKLRQNELSVWMLFFLEFWRIRTLFVARYILTVDFFLREISYVCELDYINTSIDSVGTFSFYILHIGYVRNLSVKR